MNEHLLEVHDLAKSFPGTRGRAPTPVLRGISLAVARGEFLAVVGPSGSGKSTLLYCMAGLEPPTTGTVALLGQPVGRLGRQAQARLRRNHVGFVFQTYNLIPSLTAWENVALPARLARRKISRRQIGQALETVGLGDRADHKPAMLSGGQQQRVAIARVLAVRPDIVFADEPTGALDTASGNQVLNLLREAATDGRSVVMVTHDLQAAARCDRVLVLRDGVIHRELLRPTADEVFDAVAHAETRVV
ncbi:ABC transporter ATP-binding protein [Streptomyces massasporeus]|uniref:ABC transporter ATP-binding protein n=1 Tax=Streptomyces massasporeus TaxID=67324 RepID=UPI003791323A